MDESLSSFFFFSPKVLSKRCSIEFTISISYRVIVLRVNPVRCYILYFQALSKWPHSFVIYVFFVKKINNSRIEYRKERIRLLNRDDSVEADCEWRTNFGEIIVSLTCEEKGTKFNGGALSKVTRHFKPRSAARGLPCVTSTCLCTRTHPTFEPCPRSASMPLVVFTDPLIIAAAAPPLIFALLFSPLSSRT